MQNLCSQGRKLDQKIIGLALWDKLTYSFSSHKSEIKNTKNTSYCSAQSLLAMEKLIDNTTRN